MEFSSNQTEAYLMLQTQQDSIMEIDKEFYVKLEITEESKLIGVQLSEHDNSTTSVTIINSNGTYMHIVVFISVFYQ